MRPWPERSSWPSSSSPRTATSLAYRAVVIDADSALAVERETARYYDAEEDRGDRPLEPRRVAARDRFVRVACAGVRDGPILEIGTGPGRDTLAPTEAGLDVVGVDLSYGHAARAASRGITMAVASARGLPFATGAFTGLWSMSTLMHIPAVWIDGAMREIARVLAPGAAVAIGVWAGPDVENFGDTHSNPLGHRRLFSLRSETRWRALLDLVGRLDDFEVWPDAKATDDVRYHLAHMTAHP